MSVYDNGCILTQHSPVQDLEVLLVFSEGGSVAEASHFRQSVPAFGGSLQGQRAMVTRVLSSKICYGGEGGEVRERSELKILGGS